MVLDPNWPITKFGVDLTKAIQPAVNNVGGVDVRTVGFQQAPIPETPGIIDARDYGVVADGQEINPGVVGGYFIGTDNTPFLQAAADAASAQRKALFIPPGRYRVADLGQDNIILDGDFHYIIADGVQFLVDDLGIGAPGSAVFGSTLTTDRLAKELFYLRGPTFYGRRAHFDLSTWNGNAGRRGIIVYGFEQLFLDRVNGKDIRSQFVNSFSCDSAIAANCNMLRIARAGIRFNDTPDVWIGGCRFKYTGDDAIACSANVSAGATPSEVRGRMTIIGNQAFMCGTFLIQGGRVIVVEGNNLKYMTAAAIRVGSCVGVPAITPYNIVVGQNTIENTICGVGSGGVVVDQDDGNCGITVDGVKLNALTTSAAPGFSDGTSVVDPRGKDTNGKYLISTQDASRRAGFGVVISDNAISQTKNPGATFSEFGEGLVFSHQGFWDSAMSESKLAKNGVSLILDVHGARISGNNISGHRQGAAICLDFASTDDKNRSFRDVLVTGNVAIDNKRGLSTSDADTGGVELKVGIRSIGNIWDCDPYLKSARRNGQTGKWLAGTSTTDMVCGLDLARVSGVTIRNDIFANCVTPIFGTIDPHQHADILGCVVICDPFTTGFHVDNRGVGTVPAGGKAFSHEIVNCDGTDAVNFRMLKNTCVTAASAMPSSGIYVKGHFVSNDNPVISAGKVLLGWIRLTTGAGHVDDVDWAEVWGTVA